MSITELTRRPDINRREPDLLNFTSVDTFTMGKRTSGENPLQNEDAIVNTPYVLAVIDGSSVSPARYNGLTGGKFASDTVAKILRGMTESLYGEALIKKITTEFRDELDKALVTDTSDGSKKLFPEFLKDNPHAFPAAGLCAVIADGDDFVFTRVADVTARIYGEDGEEVLASPLVIDNTHTKMRQEALLRALETADPTMDLADFLQRGADMIAPSLKHQGEVYPNTPRSEQILGYGVINGNKVPKEHIKVDRRSRKKVKRVVIHTDGYFEPGDEPTIPSYEEAHRRVEERDRYKIFEYAAVKGTMPGADATDDRGIAVATNE